MITELKSQKAENDQKKPPTGKGFLRPNPVTLAYSLPCKFLNMSVGILRQI